MRWFRFAPLLLLLLWAHGGQAQDRWPDSDAGRREVRALIDRLNGALLASHSATATLQAWCAEHRMATPAVILALPDRKAGRPPTPDVRAVLDVGANEPLSYRHVRLACGAHILSDAENWYVPSRLTPAMNQTLQTTDIPFGTVVRALHPARRTLSVERLWPPASPPGKAGDSARALFIPEFLFRHRAVLFDARHRALALVGETYRRDVLDFAH